jgi:hypothetical protein
VEVEVAEAVAVVEAVVAVAVVEAVVEEGLAHLHFFHKTHPYPID